MSSRIAIILITLLSACSLVTEVDVPAAPPALVVNSFFHPDSTFKVYVSRHWHILERPTPLPPIDVIVTLTGQDGATFTLTEFPPPAGNIGFGQRAFESAEKVVAGNTYSIKIKATGFRDAEATATTPSLVELSNVWLDSANRTPISEYTSESIPIEFTFQDPPGKGDYYYLSFLLGQERCIWDPATRKCSSQEIYWQPGSLRQSAAEEVLSELGDNVVEVLSDEFFDGELHTVRLQAYRHWWSSNEPKSFPWKLHLVHVKEDYYKYVRSKRLQDLADGNPFAQPVQVYSNISGGLGIFAGSATSTWYQPNK